MENVFVWRLESQEGIGVYQSSSLKDSTWNISTNSFKCQKRNPTFFQDVFFDNVIVNDVKHCSFGFSNLEQYKNWVFKKEWRIELEKNKAVLRKYQVEDGLFLESPFQVVFRKDFSILVEEISPNI